MSTDSPQTGSNVRDRASRAASEPAPDQAVGVPAPSVPGFIPVPIAALVGDEPVGFTLHAKSADKGMSHIRQADEKLTEDEVNKLHAEGVEFYYVATGDHEKYRHRAESGVGRLLTAESLAPSRFDLAYQIGLQLAEELLESPQEGMPARVEAYATGLVHAANFDPTMIDETVRHRPAEFRPAAHLLNMGLYGLQLAHLVQLETTDLPQLVAAMMLANVGLMGVPESVLIKEGHLSEEEWQFIHDHPQRGADWLKQCGVDERIVRVAAQHHERCDGKGFPRGMSQDALHPWTRLAAVMSGYDQLAGAKPFREALSPARAAWLLESESPGRFDPALTRLWSGWVTGHLTRAEVAEMLKKPQRNVLARGGLNIPINPRVHMGVPRAVVPMESFLPLPPLTPRSSSSSDARDRQRSGKKGDRRSHPRYRMERTCMVRCVRPIPAGQHVGFWCQTVEISRSGIQLVYPFTLGTGQVIGIFIPDKSGTTGKNMTAVVVNCRPSPRGGFRVGARFDSA